MSYTGAVESIAPTVARVTKRGGRCGDASEKSLKISSRFSFAARDGRGQHPWTPRGAWDEEFQKSNHQTGVVLMYNLPIREGKMEIPGKNGPVNSIIRV